MKNIEFMGRMYNELAANVVSLPVKTLDGRTEADPHAMLTADSLRALVEWLDTAPDCQLRRAGRADVTLNETVQAIADSAKKVKGKKGLYVGYALVARLGWYVADAGQADKGNKAVDKRVLAALA